MLKFLAAQPPCLVVMEACGGAHHWGREIAQLGHKVWLIAPIHVKPFTKRQKSDARDAAAIVEAAQRPTLRFVEVRTKESQACSTLYRTRAHLVQQRTQTVNALRGHLAEFRLVAPIGMANVKRFRQAFGENAESLPDPVIPMAGLQFVRIDELTEQIDALDKQMRSLVKEHEE